MENKFVDGLFCNDKLDWMDANLGFTPRFIEYYNANKDEKGNLRITLAKSKKTGKQYAKLNDWKPSEKFVKNEDGSLGTEEVEDELNIQEIPF